MINLKWLTVLAAVVALALFAGCGSDSSTSSSSSDTTAASTDTGSSDTGGSTSNATADDVYNACEDVIKGTPAAQAAESSCTAARDAFQQCADQAGDNTTAVNACQDAANQTVDALKAAG